MRTIKLQVVEDNKIVAIEFSDPQFNDGCWCHCLTSVPDPIIQYGGYVPKGLPHNIIRRLSTGMMDRQGREIYESDITNNGIIRWGRYNDSYIGFYLEDIEWCHKTDTPHHDTHDLFAFTTPFEALGNIYENEDLLSK